ncbi:hypothetical protein TNCV_2418271 [Trichonephila clavipes]|nr:hypothetical protein TNCV_2418271 [Trichonephila clavipes]
MAPGSPAVCGNTCGRMMSRTDRWAVIVPWINIKSNPIVQTEVWVGAMAEHVMGAAIPVVLHQGALQWFQEYTGALGEVIQGRPEPGHRVNDEFSAHWSQHLLTVNQNGLLEELLGELTTHLRSSRGFFPFRTLTAAHIVYDGGITACLLQRFFSKD